jgi:hypothetical protein
MGIAEGMMLGSREIGDCGVTKEIKVTMGRAGGGKLNSLFHADSPTTLLSELQHDFLCDAAQSS